MSMIKEKKKNSSDTDSESESLLVISPSLLGQGFEGLLRKTFTFDGFFLLDIMSI